MDKTIKENIIVKLTNDLLFIELVDLLKNNENRILKNIINDKFFNIITIIKKIDYNINNIKNLTDDDLMLINDLIKDKTNVVTIILEIKKKREFGEKASELLIFIKDTKNILDINIQKPVVREIYGYAYVFIITKNKYNIFKIIDNSIGHEINYNTVIEKDFNNFVTYLNDAIENLDANFKTKQKDMIEYEINMNNRNYEKLIDHIKKTSNLKNINSDYKDDDFFKRLKNNKEILNNLKELTIINKDIENAITEINKIKMNEKSKFLNKITDKVNTELGL
jgi:hypothetical protein